MKRHRMYYLAVLLLYLAVSVGVLLAPTLNGVKATILLSTSAIFAIIAGALQAYLASSVEWEKQAGQVALKEAQTYVPGTSSKTSPGTENVQTACQNAQPRTT